MSVHPYINFNGNCEEAVNYYTTIFNTAEPCFSRFGDFKSEGFSCI